MNTDKTMVSGKTYAESIEREGRTRRDSEANINKTGQARADQ